MECGGVGVVGVGGGGCEESATGVVVALAVPEEGEGGGDGAGLRKRVGAKVATIEKRRAKSAKGREQLRERLTVGSAFRAQAPAEAVEKTEAKLRAVEASLADDEEALRAFEGLLR